MAKQEDQTQDNTEETKTDEVDTTETTGAEEKPDQIDEKDAAAGKAAVKTSKDFDKMIDDDEDESSEGDEEDDSAAKKDGDKSDDAAKGEEDDSATGKDKDEKPSEKDDKVDSKISADVRKRAIDLGLNEEELADFEDDSFLTKTLDVIENIIEDQEEEPAQATSAQAPAEKPASKPKEGDETGDDGDGFKFDFKNEKDIDPELLANIKAMQKHHTGEVQGLRDQVNELLGTFQKQEQTRFMGRFDKMIEDLGVEFAETLGKGPTSELSRRGNAGKSREKIRTRMYAFAKGLHDAGQEIPSEQELFDVSVNSIHGKKVKTVQSARLGKKTSARSRQATQRAASRKTGELTPQQKAVATSTKFDELIDTEED